MSLWRRVSRGIRVLWNREAADREIADEVDHYLHEAAAFYEAKGMSPSAALRAARADLGSIHSVRQEVREYGWENIVDTLLIDIRHAFRRLAANRAFTAISILTLGLGVGASSTIFGVIDSVLLNPLPYPSSGQLVAVLHTAPGINIEELNMAVSLYFTYSEESRAFQHVSMWSANTWTITGNGRAQETPGLLVSPEFLDTLQVQPAAGRNFVAEDGRQAGERTVMISDDYWKTRFGADRSVLGRRIVMDGEPHTVIGILPPKFTFLDRKVSVVVPFPLDRAKTKLITFCCQGVARLKPGVSMAEANADVARMLAIAPAKFPMNPGFRQDTFREARMAPRLKPLKDQFVGDISKTLWILMGTVGLLLLIACANVANLFLVRADGRQQELAMCLALGAGRLRLARELLAESLLLGIAGGIVGFSVAFAALKILAASAWEDLPRLSEITVTSKEAFFAMGVSLAAGALFGLVSALRYSQPQVLLELRNGGRTLTSGRARQRTRKFLLVTQVAFALVLLVGSGLMIRTSWALRNVDPGFTHASELETLRIGVPETEAKNPEQVIRTQHEILRKFQSVAGVSAVAIANFLPLEGGSNDPVYAEDHAYRQGALPPIKRFKFISPGYVAAIGSRLTAGRDLTWNELESVAPVALISDTLAREFWHDPRNAVGKRIRVGIKDDWREVVGVVADVRDDGLDHRPTAIVYWPLRQKNFNSGEYVMRGVAYVIRTPRAGSAKLREELLEIVAGVNPNLAVNDVKTMEDLSRHSLARTALALTLLMSAGSLALLLGAIGIYGVISYAVAERRREIGIRVALGAQAKGVIRLFVRQGVVLACVGVVCGGAVALVMTRSLKSLLFEVSPADPATYVSAAAVLIITAAIGSYLPARRAASVDPIEALRAE